MRLGLSDIEGKHQMCISVADHSASKMGMLYHLKLKKRPSLFGVVMWQAGEVQANVENWDRPDGMTNGRLIKLHCSKLVMDGTSGGSRQTLLD